MTRQRRIRFCYFMFPVEDESSLCMLTKKELLVIILSNARTFSFFPSSSNLRWNGGAGKNHWNGEDISFSRNDSFDDFSMNSVMWKNHSCEDPFSWITSRFFWTFRSEKQEGRFNADSWTCSEKTGLRDEDVTFSWWNSSSK